MIDLIGVASGIATIGTALAATTHYMLTRGRSRRRAVISPHGHIPTGSASELVGRDEELAKLGRLSSLPGTRLILLVGGGGVGKTVLAAAYARAAVGENSQPRVARLVGRKRALRRGIAFSCVSWVTVRLRPRASELLADVVLALAQKHLNLAQTLEGRLGQLVGLLREMRCLLVIDNAESVLATGIASDRVLRDEYVHILKTLADADHRSLVLITSRLSLDDQPALQAISGRYVELKVSNLSLADARNLFDQRLGLLREPGRPEGSDSREALAGDEMPRNPLLIELAALQFASGESNAALVGATDIFHSTTADGFREVIRWYMEHLSPRHRMIALQIAIAVEGLTPVDIEQQLGRQISADDIRTAISQLQQALGLRRNSQGLVYFHQVVAELLTEWLIAECIEEFKTGRFDMLGSILLYSAHAPERQRRSSERHVLYPILTKLAELPISAIEGDDPIITGLSAARNVRRSGNGSNLASNLVTLLTLRQRRCESINFSNLLLRYVDLTRSELHECDFTGTIFRECRFVVPHGAVLDLAWSPDDRQLVGVDALGNILIWSGRGLAELAIEHVSRSWLRGVCFVGRNRVVVGGDDSELILVDAHTLHVSDRKRQPGLFWVRAISSCPDETSFLTGSEDGQARRWTLSAPGKIHLSETWPLRRGSIRAIRALDDSRAVAALDQGSVAIFATSHSGITHLRLGSEKVRCLDVHRNKELVVAFSDDVGLWVSDFFGARQAVSLNKSGSIRVLTWSLDGTSILTSGDDGVVWRWPLDDIGSLTLGDPRPIAALSGRVVGLRLAGDGVTLAVSCEGESTYLVDTSGAKAIALSNGYARRIWTLAGSPNGNQVVSGGEDRLVHVWRSDDHGRLVEIGSLPHGGRVWRARYSTSGRQIVTASDDNVVRVWDASSLDLIWEWTGHRDWVLDVTTCQSGGGDYALSASNDQRVGVWDMLGGLVAWRGHHDSRVLRLASWHRGLAVSSSSDETIAIFDPLTGAIVHRGSLPGHRAWGLDTCPHRGEIATGGDDGRIGVWAINEGAKKPTIIAEVPDMVLEIRYCLNGDLLVAGSLTEGGLYAFRRTAEGWRRLDGFGGSSRGVRALCEHKSVLLTAGSDEVVTAYGLQDLERISETRLLPFYHQSRFSTVGGLNSTQRASLAALGALEALP